MKRISRPVRSVTGGRVRMSGLLGQDSAVERRVLSAGKLYIVLACLVLLVAALTPLPASGIASASCASTPATTVVVGASAQDVRTVFTGDGDDVVVLIKNTALGEDESAGPPQYWKVDTGFGDDLVCFGVDGDAFDTAPTSGVTLDTGFGNDEVLVRRSLAASSIQLNHGNDLIYMPDPVDNGIFHGALDKPLYFGGTGGTDHVSWQNAGCAVRLQDIPGGVDGTGFNAKGYNVTSSTGCFARNAMYFSVEGFEQYTGSPWRDWLQTGDGAQTIQGLAGEDVINGGAGNDVLRGGNDGDIVRGTGGNDKVYGGGGNDTLYGGKGKDSIHGHAGDDTIYGRSGDDSMYGGSGHDTVYGGSGNDTCVAEVRIDCDSP